MAKKSKMDALTESYANLLLEEGDPEFDSQLATAQSEIEKGLKIPVDAYRISTLNVGRPEGFKVPLGTEMNPVGKDAAPDPSIDNPVLGDADPAPDPSIANPSYDDLNWMQKFLLDTKAFAYPPIKAFLDSCDGAWDTIQNNPGTSALIALTSLLGVYGIAKLVKMYKAYKGVGAAPKTVSESIVYLSKLGPITESMMTLSEMIPAALLAANPVMAHVIAGTGGQVLGGALGSGVAGALGSGAVAGATGGAVAGPLGALIGAGLSAAAAAALYGGKKLVDYNNLQKEYKGNDADAIDNERTSAKASQLAGTVGASPSAHTIWTDIQNAVVDNNFINNPTVSGFLTKCGLLDVIQRNPNAVIAGGAILTALGAMGVYKLYKMYKEYKAKKVVTEAVICSTSLKALLEEDFGVNPADLQYKQDVTNKIMDKLPPSWKPGFVNMTTGYYDRPDEFKAQPNSEIGQYKVVEQDPSIENPYTPEAEKAMRDPGFMSSPMVQNFLGAFDGAKDAVAANPGYAAAGALASVIGAYGIYKLTQMYKDYKAGKTASTAVVAESISTLNAIKNIAKNMKYCTEAQKYKTVTQISMLVESSAKIK